jgi:HPt (histidine-containing phosphotransfer) domain-containing protein
LNGRNERIFPIAEWSRSGLEAWFLPDRPFLRCLPVSVSQILPTVSPLNLQAIEDLRALNPDDDSFLRELIQIYLDDSPKQIAEIEQSLAQGDSLRLTRAAHSLKGSSAYFGAGPLRALCEKIEQLGRSAALAEILAQLPDLKAEYDRVKAALESHLPAA